MRPSRVSAGAWWWAVRYAQAAPHCLPQWPMLVSLPASRRTTGPSPQSVLVVVVVSK